MKPFFVSHCELRPPTSSVGKHLRESLWTASTEARSSFGENDKIIKKAKPSFAKASDLSIK